jgi:hypothetical protein
MACGFAVTLQRLESKLLQQVRNVQYQRLADATPHPHRVHKEVFKFGSAIGDQICSKAHNWVTSRYSNSHPSLHDGSVREHQQLRVLNEGSTVVLIRHCCFLEHILEALHVSHLGVANDDPHASSMVVASRRTRAPQNARHCGTALPQHANRSTKTDDCCLLWIGRF